MGNTYEREGKDGDRMTATHVTATPYVAMIGVAGPAQVRFPTCRTSESLSANVSTSEQVKVKV